MNVNTEYESLLQPSRDVYKINMHVDFIFSLAVSLSLSLSHTHTHTNWNFKWKTSVGWSTSRKVKLQTMPTEEKDGLNKRVRHGNRKGEGRLMFPLLSISLPLHLSIYLSLSLSPSPSLSLSLSLYLSLFICVTAVFWYEWVSLLWTRHLNRYPRETRADKNTQKWLCPASASSPFGLECF